YLLHAPASELQVVSRSFLSLLSKYVQPDHSFALNNDIGYPKSSGCRSKLDLPEFPLQLAKRDSGAAQTEPFDTIGNFGKSYLVRPRKSFDVFFNRATAARLAVHQDLHEWIIANRACSSRFGPRAQPRTQIHISQYLGDTQRIP